MIVEARRGNGESEMLSSLLLQTVGLDFLRHLPKIDQQKDKRLTPVTDWITDFLIPDYLVLIL